MNINGSMNEVGGKVDSSILILSGVESRPLVRYIHDSLDSHIQIKSQPRWS